MRLTRSRRRPGGRPRSTDRGSMAVEFVIAAPAFVLLLLLIALGGEWVSASGQVGTAARDAVRQATLEVSYADAAPTALTVARGDLGSLCPGDATALVQLLANGQQVGPAAWADGAQLAQVRVTCTVNLKVFAVLGIPASQTFTDVAAAPLDQFTERTG
jgi:Flp pilus assembly protein TadG